MSSERVDSSAPIRAPLPETPRRPFVAPRVENLGPLSVVTLGLSGGGEGLREDPTPPSRLHA